MKQTLVQRNWEIQFLGKENEKNLEDYLFHNTNFDKLLPQKIVGEFYNNFKQKDPVWYSHPISMLLTLSLFSNRQLGNK